MIVNTEDLYSYADYAKIKGMTRQNVNHHALKGTFKSIKIGGTNFIHDKSIRKEVQKK